MITVLTAALAQDGPPVDAEHFRAASDARRTIVTDEATVHAGWTASASVHYQREPLVYEVQGDYTRLVRDALALDLAGSFSVWRLRLGLTAPAYLVVTSDTDATRAVLGDAGLHAKLWLGGTTGDTAIDVAVLASVDVPLGAHRYYLGSSSWAGRLGLAGQLERGPLYVVLNAGVHLAAPQEVENVRLGHQLFGRAAIGITPLDQLAIAAEGFARFNLLADSTQDDTAEVLLGIHRTKATFCPYGSIGAGLTSGVGSPIVRAMVGLRVAPRSEQR